MLNDTFVPPPPGIVGKYVWQRKIIIVYKVHLIKGSYYRSVLLQDVNTVWEFENVTSGTQCKMGPVLTKIRALY